jgi:uncharacterized 2Fe-2S/4Fe-4S cluster protein (DUF4445 family)
VEKDMEENCKVMIGGATITAKPGTLISAFLKENAYDIDMPCGGMGKCGKCKVVARGNLSLQTREESTILSDFDLTNNIRLACTTKILGDCAISLITKEEISQIAIDGQGTVEIQRPLFANYGIAVDIGTTTVAMKLFDPKSQVGVITGRNSQIKFGADVITRIDKALRGEAAQIQATIVACLNEMMAALCHKHGIDKYQIDAVVITGNTAMMFLLTQEDPDSLSHTPFLANRLFGEYIAPKEIGLDLAENAKIYLTRCIGAYVGGDISTAILASGMTEKPETALLVDIGTNGEMALWHQNTLVCCSTAAGPAFEGAEIAKGMNAAEGAIDTIWAEGKQIRYTVIGGVTAKGICGSGIIDAISVLKDLEIIQPNGAFTKEAPLPNNLLRTIDNQIVCKITNKVYISQKDVRMVQLAKSAICAGIYTLIDEAGILVEDIRTLYLAGGFGNYLNINNAANIGLFPADLAAKTKIIGNAALQGAVQILVNQDVSERRLIERLNINLVDLGAHKHFLDNYINCMGF